MQIKDCAPGDTIELWGGIERGKRYKLGTEHKPSDFTLWVECYELPSLQLEYLNKNLTCVVAESAKGKS